MLSFAIITLAWSLLIIFACYLVMAEHSALGSLIGDMMLAAWICMAASIGILIWGIWFVAQRWQHSGLG